MVLTQMAHLRLSQGRTMDADKLLDQALNLFPNYHYALGNGEGANCTEKV